SPLVVTRRQENEGTAGNYKRPGGIGTENSLDPEFLDPIPQRPKADPEDLRRRRLVVPRLLERLHDPGALDLLELRLERAADRADSGSRGTVPHRLLHPRPQPYIPNVDLVPRAQRQRPLEDVLELAHVPRKPIPEQRRLCRLRQPRRRHPL